MMRLLWKIVWQFIKMLNTMLEPHDLAIPLLGINPREMKLDPHKNLYMNFTAEFF